MDIQNLRPDTYFGQDNRYSIIKRIQKTNMSVVYSAYDNTYKGKVAIKFLLTDSLRNRFDRETEALKKLESLNNPYIIKYIDSGVMDNNIPYIVTEWLEGGTLRERMGQLSKEETCDLVLKLARAFDEINRQGIIHRDIKPANVMFDSRGEPHIIDFGICKFTYSTNADLTQVEDHTQLTRNWIGSPPYMAPEQFEQYEHLNTDQYCFAIVIYQLITGEFPYTNVRTNSNFSTFVEAHTKAPPEPIHKKRPDLSRKLSKVFERALAKKADDRYKTMRDFAEAFRIAIEDDAPKPYSTVIIAAIAVVSLALVGVGVVIINLLSPAEVNISANQTSTATVAVTEEATKNLVTPSATPTNTATIEPTDEPMTSTVTLETVVRTSTPIPAVMVGVMANSVTPSATPTNTASAEPTDEPMTSTATLEIVVSTSTPQPNNTLTMTATSTYTLMPTATSTNSITPSSTSTASTTATSTIMSTPSIPPLEEVLCPVGDLQANKFDCEIFLGVIEVADLMTSAKGSDLTLAEITALQGLLGSENENIDRLRDLCLSGSDPVIDVEPRVFSEFRRNWTGVVRGLEMCG